MYQINKKKLRNIGKFNNLIEHSKLFRIFWAPIIFLSTLTIKHQAYLSKPRFLG